MEKAILSHFGAQIAELRKAKGLTLEALGNIVGMSKQYLSNIENGSSPVSIGKMSKIARALGCEITIQVKPG